MKKLMWFIPLMFVMFNCNDPVGCDCQTEDVVKMIESEKTVWTFVYRLNATMLNDTNEYLVEYYVPNGSLTEVDFYVYQRLGYLDLYFPDGFTVDKDCIVEIEFEGIPEPGPKIETIIFRKYYDILFDHLRIYYSYQIAIENKDQPNYKFNQISAKVSIRKPDQIIE